MSLPEGFVAEPEGFVPEGFEAEGVGFDARIRQPINRDLSSIPTGGDMKDTPMSILDKVLANPILGAVTEFAADVPRNIFNAPGYLVNQASQAMGGPAPIYQVGRGESILPEVLPSAQTLATFPLALAPGAPPSVNPQAAGLLKGVEDVVRGLATPESLMSLGAIKSPNLGNTIGTLFGLQSVAHLPEASAEVGRLSVEGSPEDTARAGLNAFAQAAIAGHIASGGALGFNEAYQNRPLRPEVLPPLDQRPVAPTSRQIADAPEGFIDLEHVKTAQGDVYQSPVGQEKLLEGPKRQFVADETGVVSPRANYPWLEGQDALAHLQPKKAFSGDLPIIGQEQGVPLTGYPAIEAKLNEVLERIKAAEGKIIPVEQNRRIEVPGFEKTAETGLTKYDVNWQPNETVAPLESPLIQQATGYNPPTQVPSTPPPFDQWQAAQQKKAAKRGMEEGLVGPATQYVGDESLPYAKEGQYPVEGGPTGTFSNLQRQRIQAGKEGVRSNVSNNPPMPQAGGVAQSPLMPYDAASLPAGSKMISGEGQSSGQAGKAPQIEDANIPERPVSAAIRTKDGRIFTGQIHATAGIKAMKSGVSGEDMNSADRGFWTNKDRYITEEEAKATYGKTRTEEFGLKPKTGLAAEKFVKPSYDQLVAQLKAIPNTLENFNKRIELSKQIEAIKNENKGMPPGKKSGSTVEPDEPNGRLYGGIFFLDPKFWTENFGSNSHVQMDAKQMYNRIRNKLNEKSKTWQNMDTEELRKFIFGKEKISAKEVADFITRQEQQQKELLVQGQEKWWEEVKPQVEVKKFGVGASTPEQKRLAEVEHKLDTTYANWRVDLRNYKANKETQPRTQMEKLMDEYFDLEASIAKDKNRPMQGSHWQSVAPKPESEMLGYVELAVVRPLKEDKWRQKERDAGVESSRGAQFPSAHNFPPNTLAFSRGYMEGDTFNVIESQTDIAQEVSDGVFQVLGHPELGKFDSKQAALKAAEKIEPLMAEWQKMNLMNAIEHARSVGAKRIAIQDAESAMLMEGHDTAAKRKVEFADVEQAKQFIRDKYPYIAQRYNILIPRKEIEVNPTDSRMLVLQDKKTGHSAGGVEMQGHNKPLIELNDWDLKQRLFGSKDEDGSRVIKHVDREVNVPINEIIDISQEKGMRHHYDRLMPQIMEELTGEKGERVSFGEHKNAYLSPDVSFASPESELNARGSEVRKDLIFRNSDGSPKTDISALSYPIPEQPQPKSKGIGGGMQKAVDKNKEAGSIPNLFHRKNRPIKSSEFQYILKYGPYAQEVADATKPRGFGKALQPVAKAGEKLESTGKTGIEHAGKLLNMVAGTDPRATASNPVAKAIIANAVQSQKGQNFAALWQENQRDVQRAFETDDQGRVTLANGNKAYMSDVIEAELANPGSQSLTPAQRNFVNEWKGLRQQIVSYAQSQGTKTFVDEDGAVIPLNENYFPRPAVGKEGIKQTIKDSVRKQVGGKQFFAKGRYYDTEAAGSGAGIKYDPDEFSRIGRWMSAVYKAIADTRMANDPALGGRSISQGPPKFLEEGMVFQPAFSGRVFDKPTADKLNRYYGETTHAWVKSLANMNDFLKAFQFSVDVSAPLNQGLPLMGVNPARWAKATVKSYASLADDRILNKYLQDPTNQRVARDIIENGGSLVRLQDFLAGAEQGKLAGKIAPIRASARSMGTFLSIAKIEMYKAFESQMKPGDTKADLVEAVENATLSGKMEGIGLQQGRALGERLLFNAPSYIRAAFNNVAAAGQGKISGRVARRAIIGMGVAIMAQMYALYKMLGLDDEEITKRFNPTRPEFLRYPHKMANGQIKEISYGNILIGLARLAGDSINYLDGTKKLGSGEKGNPWLRWISYRESPLGNLLWELKSGEDFRGEPLSAKEALAKSILPVSLSPMVEGQTKESRVKGVLAQGLGLSAYDESAGAFERRTLNELGMKQFGKPFERLNSWERRQVSGEAEDAAKGLGQKVTPRQIMNIQTALAERKKTMTDALSQPAKDWLRTNNLSVTGYTEKMTEHKKELSLANDEEKKLLQQLMQKHTQERIDMLMESGIEVDQDGLNERLKLAHKRAWREFKEYLETKK